MITAILRTVTAPKISYTNLAVGVGGGFALLDHSYLAAITVLLVGGIVSGIVDHTVRQKVA